MSITAIIVDDEPIAQDIIETYLDRGYNEKIELLGKAKNPVEANDLLKANEVDLMFLDINMPKLSGIEFLKMLDNPPLTILSTAHSEYALESYELDVVDYLLKPFSEDRFRMATDKAIEMINQRSSATTEEDDFIFVKSDKKYVKVFYDDIYIIEGLKDYVMIRLEDSRIIALHTMKSLEEKLEHYDFKRVHRSYIVNMDKISSVVGNSLEITLKKDKELIPIGKSYRSNIQDLIDKHKL